MTDYDSAALERAATDESIDLDDRDVRALTEYLTVLEDVGRARGGEDLYLVVSQSGSEYLVDTRLDACECADAEYRDPDSGCKHARRVAFATGAREIPAGVDRDALDDQLGLHVSGEPRQAATDGGEIIVAGDEGEILDETGDQDDECEECAALSNGVCAECYIKDGVAWGEE